MDLPHGYTLERHAEVDSTNTIALRRAAAGAAHGTVILAETQSAGRGRRGRAWASLPGNLFITILARPPAARTAGQLSFVAAVALGEVLADFADIMFKWPNDILSAGRKIAGILIEADHGAAAIGIGVNLIAAPDELAATAGDLGGRLDRIAAAEALCQAFDLWYRRWIEEGFAPVRTAWLDRAAGLDAPLGAGGRTGRFAGLDADGGLILVDGSGTAHVITGGEVLFGEPACC